MSPPRLKHAPSREGIPICFRGKGFPVESRSFPHLQTRIREARPSDKEPLIDFIKDVWGGHDYIPKVWDAWIGDRKARMFVVEVDGRPVGMNRMRFLPDGVAWLEGARIHPDFRRKGLATM